MTRLVFFVFCLFCFVLFVFLDFFFSARDKPIASRVPSKHSTTELYSHPDCVLIKEKF
jgi:hypothetical protein